MPNLNYKPMHSVVDGDYSWLYASRTMLCPAFYCFSQRCSHSYGALVGALQRQFGQCLQPGLLQNDDVESLTQQAYAHMDQGMQSELARDQFIRALFPTELCVQVQLQHPQTLQVEREIVWDGATLFSSS